MEQSAYAERGDTILLWILNHGSKITPKLCFPSACNAAELKHSSVHIYSNVSRIEMNWGFYRNHLWFQVFLRAFCSINCLEKEGTHYGFSLMVFSLLVRSWSMEFPHSPLFYHIFGSPCGSLSSPAEKLEWAPSKAWQILPVSGGCSDSISSFMAREEMWKFHIWKFLQHIFLLWIYIVPLICCQYQRLRTTAMTIWTQSTATTMKEAGVCMWDFVALIKFSL